MTTAEKEKRILDLGKPWSDIMKGLAFHRSITKDEESSPHRDGIIRTREDYYSQALSVVLDCAHKSSLVGRICGSVVVPWTAERSAL